MSEESPIEHLSVESVPPQLADVASDRRHWRAIHVDGELVGAIGFNQSFDAGGLYLAVEARWVIFWPVDRELLEAELANYLRGRFGARPKVAGRTVQ